MIESTSFNYSIHFQNIAQKLKQFFRSFDDENDVLLPDKFVAIPVFAGEAHQTLMVRPDNVLMYRFAVHAMLFLGIRVLVLVLLNQMCLFVEATKWKFISENYTEFEM